ncbi:unnamed protein product [Eruca vesicaria subsp. sativa]|uniref:RIN4 pathogenic type III effector avirulence factor Avr cleavage site domain-containing protein n=1 Tax=Eruca vesicaria subsp. sativa TaxID=29727 RepID=A0ABC8M7Q1_ERUVS|nr:unnamed protein product [Eruca vesicaria subsp. sativa]
MEVPKENKNSPWLSVPQFGDWDQKGGTIPDYSMDFTKIREMRKQNKRDHSRASLGNEEELVNPFHNQHTKVENTKPRLTTVHSDDKRDHTEFSHHQQGRSQSYHYGGTCPHNFVNI